MFINLLLLFTILPAMELYVLLKVGSVIGAGSTILIILLTGVSGAYLARLQGFLLLNKIQSDLNQGIMPTEQMTDGLMVLVGGILLLTPGFITDTLGFLLLIPITRAIIKRLIKNKMEQMIKNGQSIQVFTKPKDNNQYDDIDIT